MKDRHCRKSPNDSMYFYGDFHRCFNILFSNQKTKEAYHIGLKYDFLFKLYGWRHCTMKNLQYLIPLSRQEKYLGVCLSAN